jgi:hypothetical protein
MLRRNTLFAAAEPRQFAPFLQLLDCRCHHHPLYSGTNFRPSTARHPRSIVRQFHVAAQRVEFLLI